MIEYAAPGAGVLDTDFFSASTKLAYFPRQDRGYEIFKMYVRFVVFDPQLLMIYC
jgi:hypothetical protein